MIHPTYVMFTYTSKSINLYDLTSGSNPLEFLNIVNINDLRLTIEPYELKQRLPWDEALKLLSKFYIDDLVNNQKINLARAIGPLRAVISVSGAVWGLFSTPYREFMNERGSVIRGVGESVRELYSVVTEEGGYFAAKVISGVKKVV